MEHMTSLDTLISNASQVLNNIRVSTGLQWEFDRYFYASDGDPILTWRIELKGFNVVAQSNLETPEELYGVAFTQHVANTARIMKAIRAFAGKKRFNS